MKKIIVMVVAVCMFGALMCGCELGEMSDRLGTLLSDVQMSAEQWGDVATQVGDILHGVSDVAATITGSTNSLGSSDVLVDAPTGNEPSTEPEVQPSIEPSTEPAVDTEINAEPEAMPSTEPVVEQVTQVDTYVTAEYADVNLTVDGEAVDLPLYEIEHSNYIKLRDFAYLIQSTGKRFDVEWNEDIRSIDLIIGRPYTPNGTEFEYYGFTDKQAKLCTSPIYVDGVVSDIEAYEIDDSNFVKLRDICDLLGISVKWDEATQTVVLEGVIAKQESTIVVEGAIPEGIPEKYKHFVENYTPTFYNEHIMSVGESEASLQGSIWLGSSLGEVFCSDNSVVQVIENGVVTAVGEGVAYVVFVGGGSMNVTHKIVVA